MFSTNKDYNAAIQYACMCRTFMTVRQEERPSIFTVGDREMVDYHTGQLCYSTLEHAHR